MEKKHILRADDVENMPSMSRNDDVPLVDSEQRVKEDIIIGRKLDKLLLKITPFKKFEKNI